MRKNLCSFVDCLFVKVFFFYFYRRHATDTTMSVSVSSRIPLIVVGPGDDNKELCVAVGGGPIVLRDQRLSIFPGIPRGWPGADMTCVYPAALAVSEKFYKEFLLVLRVLDVGVDVRIFRGEHIRV
jgi:hypothetical protein